MKNAAVRHGWRILLLALSTLSFSACTRDAGNAAPVDYSGPVADWPSFGGAPGGGHYSPAGQITVGNVARLQKAWEYRSGDFRGYASASIELSPGLVRDSVSSAWQMTPILVDGTLYGCSSFNRVFALDPQSGRERWSFDPGVDTTREYILNCRGVSSWQAAERHGKHCEHRIFAGTMDGRLLALDGKDGSPCTDFGKRGQIDLSKGLGEFAPLEYNVTSPPAVIGDLVITGAMLMDRINDSLPSGVVRAFDVRSGKLVWYWDPVPPGSEPSVDGQQTTYRRGSINVWSIISVDEARDLVFLPTGGTSTDFYGGQRNGLDYYGSSVVALRGSTGELVWHRQLVHHDIWDYDTPSEPSLYEFERDGKLVPALAQPTKMGHLFLLNRETGEPLFGIEERPVPTSGEVPGEYLSPTQPFPLKPLPLHPHTLEPADAWGLSFWDRGQCRKKLQELRNEGIFTPPSLQGSVFFPSDYGGHNWGSPAIDPQRGLIIMSTLFMPAKLQLIPREQCRAKEDPLMWPQTDTPYCLRVEPLMSPLGIPCSAPPWSTLVAVDYRSGEKRWEVPLGTLEGLAPWPLSRIRGAPIAGGPSVTAAGLTFIAATSDMYIRAFDSDSGRELWKYRLPTGGHAVPMSYRAGAQQKQYLVIAAGGHYGMPHEPPGDWLIAFALPDEHPQPARP